MQPSRKFSGRDGALLHEIKVNAEARKGSASCCEHDDVAMPFDIEMVGMFCVPDENLFATLRSCVKASLQILIFCLLLIKQLQASRHVFSPRFAVCVLSRSPRSLRIVKAACDAGWCDFAHKPPYP